MARGTWRRSDAVFDTAGAEPRMVPHDQRPHHLDAGQVGISLVRRLGSGISHDRAVDRRHRFRQAAARPAARPGLPASDRSDPGLRVELQRRQSAGAGLGHDLSLPDGAGAAGQDRSRFPEAGLWQADLEFRLVGEPQGPLRQEPVRGRISRTGQYRRLRPQRAVAHRRLSGAGRRHRLGGLVLPEHARDRVRACGTRSHL